MDANAKLDEEIQVQQTRRTRYESRIEAAETQLQTIRTQANQLVEIEKLKLLSHRLAIEIKDNVTSYDVYINGDNYGQMDPIPINTNDQLDIIKTKTNIKVRLNCLK